MNRKSTTISAYSLLLILLIGLFVTGTILIMRLWLGTNECETLQYDCKSAKVEFCGEWVKNTDATKEAIEARFNALYGRSISDIKSCKYDSKKNPITESCDFPTTLQGCKEFLGVE